MIEIIDLRYSKEKIDAILSDTKILPGYHMNKKSWITIKLDESIDTMEIFKLIDNSYRLSIGNKCGITGESLGNKGLARVVGNILHKNPDGDKYPCYKVLNSKGELADAFVFGGKEIQKERLEKDGIKVRKNKVDLSLYQWKERY